jgi:hypothetical protein
MEHQEVQETPGSSGSAGSSGFNRCNGNNREVVDSGISGKWTGWNGMEWNGRKEWNGQMIVDLLDQVEAQDLWTGSAGTLW